MDHCARRCRKSHRGGDHFIARRKLLRGRGKVKPRCAGIQADRVTGTNVFLEVLFKLKGSGTGSQPAGLKCFNNFIDFIINTGLTVGEIYVNSRSIT